MYTFYVAITELINNNKYRINVKNKNVLQLFDAFFYVKSTETV